MPRTAFFFLFVFNYEAGYVPLVHTLYNINKTQEEAEVKLSYLLVSSFLVSIIMVYILLYLSVDSFHHCS